MPRATLWNTPCVSVVSSGEIVQILSLDEVFDVLPQLRDVHMPDPVTRAQSVIILSSIVARSTVEAHPDDSPLERMRSLREAEWAAIRHWVFEYRDKHAHEFSLDEFMQSPSLTYSPSKVKAWVMLSPAWGGKGAAPPADLEHADAVWRAATTHWFSYGRCRAHDGATAQVKASYSIPGPGLSMHLLVEGACLCETVLHNITSAHLTDADVPGWESPGGLKRAASPVGPVSFDTRQYRRLSLVKGSTGRVSDIHVGRGDDYAPESVVHDVRGVLQADRGVKVETSTSKAPFTLASAVSTVCSSPPAHVSNVLRDWKFGLAPISVTAPQCGPNDTTLRGTVHFKFDVNDELLNAKSTVTQTVVSARMLYGKAFQATKVYARLVRGSDPTPFHLRADEVFASLLEGLVHGEDPDGALKAYGKSLVDLLLESSRACDEVAPIRAYLPDSSPSGAMKARKVLNETITDIRKETDPEYTEE